MSKTPWGPYKPYGTDGQDHDWVESEKDYPQVQPGRWWKKHDRRMYSGWSGEEIGYSGGRANGSLVASGGKWSLIGNQRPIKLNQSNSEIVENK